jgi:hypothetical protein
MNSITFNTALSIGLVSIMGGVALLHSVGAALVVGGLFMVGITLLLARWAGVASRK